jgi:hypothetical protein
MAVGEKRSTWVISQVSWTDWTAQDVYYWQEHSFQYAANINCDDELHGIKLSNKAWHTGNFAKCQLVSDGEHWVFALPVEWWDIKLMSFNGSSFNTWTTIAPAYWSSRKRTPWVIFQDRFWWGWGTTASGAIYSCSVTWGNQKAYIPYDHTDSTDDSISNKDDLSWIFMWWAITAILNYNNTRLVVATSGGSDNCAIWVYYPELDTWYAESWIYGKTWWKRVLNYEAWVNVVALTCTFEYLKVWAVDEWWSTKVYYYQGNNNLRDTFVYNVVDLTWERVLRAYSINGTDYYITSIDWTDGYVNLNKMVGNTPVMLFHQRAWLDPLDVNYKAPYFVWPVWLNAAYKSGRFYIADSYGVFQFTQNQQGFDKWYMKWLLSDTTRQVYWVCENQWFLYVSDQTWCWAMRLYDTWVDGFQSNWVLISREYEGKEWGTITKMLDEIRLNYELNPSTNNKWSIDIYVSPNNLWKNTHTFTEANWWYHVMHIDNTNWATRTEKSNLFNDLGTWDNSSFKFDWQTITYAIVINQNTSTHATPIVRQIDIRYHTKDKVNNVYDIN